jgi:hypothetical protein
MVMLIRRGERSIYSIKIRLPKWNKRASPRVFTTGFDISSFNFNQESAMTRTLTQLLAALLLAITPMAQAAPLSGTATLSAAAEEKVVYHINDSENAMAALHNVQNHLNASKDVHIVVVTHGKGIDFLLTGAQDRNGNLYEPVVQNLKEKGVDFRVCNNTLMSRKLETSTVIPEATIVPSGVAEIGRLQAREGYVYLKP